MEQQIVPKEGIDMRTQQPLAALSPAGKATTEPVHVAGASSINSCSSESSGDGPASAVGPAGAAAADSASAGTASAESSGLRVPLSFILRRSSLAESELRMASS